MARAGIPRRHLLAGGLVLAGGAALIGPGTAEAAPPILDCAAWGARPPSEPVKIWDQRPVKILVHHTATPNVVDFSAAAAVALAVAIQKFHMDGRGWLDTGQHFTISRGGVVLEGRHRSLEILRGGRQQVEGAHCTGQNVVAIGIENEGIYTDIAPPKALWDRLRETCAYICSQYGIPPTELYGHRDFKDTACPGDNLYGSLPRLRSEVAGLLGRRIDAVESAPPRWPLLRTGDVGPAVRAAQQLLHVPVDGAYSPQTADAVRLFQIAHRTEEVNGILGGETWPLLVAGASNGPAVLAAAGITPPDPSATDPAATGRR
ncbi:peptidoglycan recognition protein family protein [Pseudonocardia sp. CA-107938]|uniref:peptidoglycan recognition protein family protein n=1 Tax=Pseudonocardia sp. CA-107938 TaxID=3240021 RepID=UPI003D8CD009